MTASVRQENGRLTCCEDTNEPLDFAESKELLNQLTHCCLLRKNCV